MGQLSFLQQPPAPRYTFPLEMLTSLFASKRRITRITVSTRNDVISAICFLVNSIL